MSVLRTSLNTAHHVWLMTGREFGTMVWLALPKRSNDVTTPADILAVYLYGWSMVAETDGGAVALMPKASSAVAMSVDRLASGLHTAKVFVTLDEARIWMYEEGNR